MTGAEPPARARSCGRGIALTGVALLFAGGACALATPPVARASRGALHVVAAHPHDRAAFTQGLLWHDGRLYESVGRYGASALREVEIGSGRVVREVRLPAREFGEGLALLGGTLYQLTWREGLLHRWRRDDFAALGDLAFRGEGWGLTSDGERLIQSDGTATLSFRSPADFSLLGSVEVRRDGVPVHYLNELEWVEGAIYANVWMSDELVRIDPASGEVTAVFDASGLLPAAERGPDDVLNGIAWNPESRRFYLTGKLWPQLFEVELELPRR